MPVLQTGINHVGGITGPWKVSQMGHELRNATPCFSK